MATLDKLPTGLWRARVRKRGYPPQTRSFRLQADAQAWARKVESSQERGVWRDLGDADTMTLTAALDAYAEAPDVKEHRGYRAELSVLGILRDESLAKLPLARIDERAVKNMARRWRNDGYAPSTIRRRLGVLSSVFRHAAPKLENPAAGAKPKEGDGRERRVSDAEINAICSASDSPSLSAVVTLAVETGMRRGELCRLTNAMIDVATGVAHLPAHITKSNKARDVPLSPRALEVLRALPRRSRAADPVLGIRPDSTTQAFVRAVRRARKQHVAGCDTAGECVDPNFLIDVRFHDLRHEATSRLAGIFALHELMKITGHQSTGMLMRYYNPTAADFAARMRDAASVGSSPTQA